MVRADLEEVGWTSMIQSRPGVWVLKGKSGAFRGKRVWIAGYIGMVGSVVVRHLESEELAQHITARSSEVDLTRQSETEAFVVEISLDLLAEV